MVRFHPSRPIQQRGVAQLGARVSGGHEVVRSKLTIPTLRSLDAVPTQCGGTNRASSGSKSAVDGLVWSQEAVGSNPTSQTTGTVGNTWRRPTARRRESRRVPSISRVCCNGSERACQVRSESSILSTRTSVALLEVLKLGRPSRLVIRDYPAGCGVGTPLQGVKAGCHTLRDCCSGSERASQA